MKNLVYIFSGLLFVSSFTCLAQENLSFEGHLSSWGNFNPNIDLPVWIGGRYIPKTNYNIPLADKEHFDFELSVNMYGTLNLHPFDTAHTDGKIKLYRTWSRYSTDRFEIRLGLQKINFGSATIMRPLMWFDRIDPRDPLQLTDGVWGILTRYYFLNNANIWIWGLYGNSDTKGWEIAKTNKDYPEIGGRIQYPIPKGEAAFSYHFRVADTRDLGNYIPSYEKVVENRIGVDTKVDLTTIGLWFEGVWVNNNKNLGKFTNQEFLNVGVDYTFEIGNGLHILFEQLLASYDEKAFSFSDPVWFSSFSGSYSLGIFDNLGVIVYYDWKNNNMYNFINWQRQFDNLSIFLITYWNPKNSSIPFSGRSENLYSGKGIQLMLVYNH